MIAAQNGHLNVVRALCEKDRTLVNPDNIVAVDVLYIAAQEGHLEMVKYLIEDFDFINSKFALTSTAIEREQVHYHKNVHRMFLVNYQLIL